MNLYYPAQLRHRLAVLAAAIALSSTSGSAQQTINLTRAACSISKPSAELACHWQNSNMSCTWNCTDFTTGDAGTSCIETGAPGIQKLRETTTQDGVTTTVTTSCYSSLSMDANCQPTDNKCTQQVTTVVGGGGCGSPIVIDTAGKGFQFTSAQDGVQFDISGTRNAVQIGWTAAGSRNAFLALDRNQNGRIDNGKELFGNFTRQPPSDSPNGFLALAQFDKPEHGGNGDGVIDQKDAVFSKLVLWIDENHDGISQPNEMHTLPEMGVYSLSLQYKQTLRADPSGNWLRYKGKINTQGQPRRDHVHRVIYDVFFETLGPDGRPYLCCPQCGP